MLVYWRKRIAKFGRPDRVFDAVAVVIAQNSDPARSAEAVRSVLGRVLARAFSH